MGNKGNYIKASSWEFVMYCLRRPEAVYVSGPKLLQGPPEDRLNSRRHRVRGKEVAREDDLPRRDGIGVMGWHWTTATLQDQRFAYGPDRQKHQIGDPMMGDGGKCVCV